MRLWFGWGLLLLGSGCLKVYTFGEANGNDCGDGQVACGDGCVAMGSICDDCPESQVKCGDACVEPDTCVCDRGCDAELEVCGDGVCLCRVGLMRCGAACVDTRSDPDHCGSCDAMCGGAKSLCQESECAAQCQAPRATCGGACVDTNVDSLHCGGCDMLCKSAEVCMTGECRGFDEISDCAACPCPGACGEFDTAGGGDENGGECCDSPFVGGPVCVEDGCD